MLQSLLQALQDSAPATAIREGQALFPWIESVHVLAITLVIGSIAIVDLRLLWISSCDRSVRQITALALPVTWSAFVVAALSGGLLFSSNATVYAHNPFMRAKLLLIAAAGLNMLVYQWVIGVKAGEWHTPAQTPKRARLAGGLSLALWIAIVACGRWIGFTLTTPN